MYAHFNGELTMYNSSVISDTIKDLLKRRVVDYRLREINFHVPLSFSTTEFRESFESVLIDSFGGFTMVESVGAWRNDTGKVIR